MIKLLLSVLLIFLSPSIIFAQNQGATNVEIDPEKIKVQKHFIGRNGEKLPSPEELKLEQEQYQKHLEDTAPPINLPSNSESSKIPEREIKFPECVVSGLEFESDSSVSSLFAQGASTKSKSAKNSSKPQVFIDILFSKQFPDKLDIDEVLGKGVKVLKVGEKSTDLITQAAIVMGVECLPTRLRKTMAGRYWIEGEKSYLNFDLDSNGKFHPLVIDALKIKGK